MPQASRRGSKRQFSGLQCRLCSGIWLTGVGVCRMSLYRSMLDSIGILNQKSIKWISIRCRALLILLPNFLFFSTRWYYPGTLYQWQAVSFLLAYIESCSYSSKNKYKSYCYSAPLNHVCVHGQDSTRPPKVRVTCKLLSIIQVDLHRWSRKTKKKIRAIILTLQWLHHNTTCARFWIHVRNPAEAAPANVEAAPA